jgi:uncharacterized membrane protein YbjE (DUF340 family)
MWTIFISLGVGIFLGFSNKLPKKVIRHNDQITFYGVVALLFIMGISIGMNKEIVKNIQVLGLQSLVFAFFGVLGSVIVVFMVSKILLRGGKPS